VKTSDSQLELSQALFAAWQAFPHIAKTKEGQAGNRKFMYTPFDQILEQVRPVLIANGLLLTQGTEGHSIITRIEHAPSGEWRETSMPVNAEHANMQSYGIELTYRRRYAAILMLGIITEDDTDGLGARERKTGVNHVTEKKAGSSGRDVCRQAFEALQPEIQEQMRKTAAHMTRAAPRAPVEAINIFDMAASQLEHDKNELKTAIWYLLDSSTRSIIKKAEAAE
jgi:hypothetical protein